MTIASCSLISFFRDRVCLRTVSTNAIISSLHQPLTNHKHLSLFDPAAVTSVKQSSIQLCDYLFNISTVLDILLQHPQIVGCNRIADYNISYRLTSAGEDWTVTDEPSASSTLYTLRNLEFGDYVFRVVVTNDDDLSNFTDAPIVYIYDVKCEDDITRELIIGIVSLLVVITLVAIVALLLRR